MSSFGIQLFLLCLWIKSHYGFHRTNSKCSFNKKIKCLDDISYSFCFNTASTSLLYGAIKYCPMHTICSEDTGIKPCIKQAKLIINQSNVPSNISEHGSTSFEEISNRVTFPTTYINDQEIDINEDVTTNIFINKENSTPTPLIITTTDIYQTTTNKIISTTDYPFMSPINTIPASEIDLNFTIKFISTTDFPIMSPIDTIPASEIGLNFSKKLISTTKFPFLPNNKNRTYQNEINKDVKQNYKVIPRPKRKKTNTKISNIHNKKRKKKPLLSSISTFLTKLRKKSAYKRKHYSIKPTKKSAKISNKKPLKVKLKNKKISSKIPVNYLKVKKPSKNGSLQKNKIRKKNQNSNKLRENFSDNSISTTINMTNAQLANKQYSITTQYPYSNLDKIMINTQSTLLTQKLTTIDIKPLSTTAKSITTTATKQSTTTTEENIPPVQSTTTIKATSESTTATSTIKATSESSTATSTIKATSESTTATSTIKATSESTTATSTIKETSESKTAATILKAITESTTQNVTTNLCSIFQRLYQSSIQLSTTTTTEATTFSTGRPSICDTPGKYPGDKCNDYHECLSVMWWFRWVPRKCERGYSFDPVTSTCVINVFCK